MAHLNGNRISTGGSQEDVQESLEIVLTILTKATLTLRPACVSSDVSAGNQPIIIEVLTVLLSDLGLHYASHYCPNSLPVVL